jgi:hypothetical protein
MEYPAFWLSLKILGVSLILCIVFWLLRSAAADFRAKDQPQNGDRGSGEES